MTKVVIDLEVINLLVEAAQQQTCCSGLDLRLANMTVFQITRWLDQVPRVTRLREQYDFPHGNFGYVATLADQQFAWVDWDEEREPYDLEDGSDVVCSSYGGVMLTEEQRKKWILQQIHFVVSEIQKRDGAFGLPLTDEEYDMMALSDLERILNELKQLAKLPPSR